MLLVATAFWAAFLVAAIFYTRTVRHPRAQPLAAYLIFVMVFTAGSFVVFATLTLLLRAAERTDTLDDPIAGAIFLALVFVPAFLAARWQLRKPPRRPRVP